MEIVRQIPSLCPSRCPFFCFPKSESQPRTVLPAKDNLAKKCWSDTPERSGTERILMKESRGRDIGFASEKRRREKKMKKMNVKEYYSDFEITSMQWSERVIHIAWQLPSRSLRSESCLYRHRDGSWHLDADSRQYGREFAKVLSDRMARFFLHQICPAAEEPDYRGPSEISRIERILKNDRDYRRAIRKKDAEEKDKPRRISAWHAEGAV